MANGHGGARPGAGRKPQPGTVLRRSGILAYVSLGDRETPVTTALDMRDLYGGLADLALEEWRSACKLPNGGGELGETALAWWKRHEELRNRQWEFAARAADFLHPRMGTATVTIADDAPIPAPNLTPSSGDPFAPFRDPGKVSAALAAAAKPS